MALHVTQCPRCESTFNTSARLLEAAHGLVRCGACLSIFEADQHFIDTMVSASNDDESVFISAPEDYVDPAKFLQDGNASAQEDNGDREALYAKSDVHDSHFDVFDVDPEEYESPATEQLLDSDFDVFDVADMENTVSAAEQDLQDNEFDIYDAGEREIRRPPFMLSESSEGHGEGDDSQLQLSVTFSFDPSGSQVNFTTHPLPDSLWSTGTAVTPAANAGTRQEPKPYRTVEGPEPPVLSEVILPVGPDARTMLEALKKANEQSKNEEESVDQDAQDQAESDDIDFLYDDIELEPVDGRFLDAETVVPVGDDSQPTETVWESEWEEAQVDIDETSFVILPTDPYQPSAFRHDDNDTTPDDKSDNTPNQPDPQATGRAETQRRRSRSQLRAASAAGESGNHRSRSRQGEDRRQPVVGNPGDDTQPRSPGAAATIRQDDQPVDNPKDEIRAQVMSSEFDDQDQDLEQLSEENLRAVRDVDSSLELVQRRKMHNTRRIAQIAAGCVLLALLFTLAFFWYRMPQLSQDPRFRPWYQSLCDVFGCQLAPFVNPGQVQTDNLVVRSHPQLADTLEMTAVFRNQAAFPQPFPLIELRFADLNDATILSQQFSPDEYLPVALRGMPLMPVGAPVQITLTLEDPGPQAVNYRLEFKAAPPRPGS